ncbi:MAG: carbohydrate-binding protein, partial [Phycisphaerales bacterium]|nr:carbohydrate-binding protein [Phycisphaerales bacterium]
ADGNTWTDITPVKPAGGDTFGYSAVTVDVHDPNLLLVSTLDRWAKGDDIFRSRDGGRTWKGLRDTAIRDASAAPWITFGSPGGAAFGHWISSVALDPADAQHLIYITGWGMWESRDTNAADDGRPTHWTFAGLGIDEGVMTEVISPPSGAPVLSTLWDLDGFRHTDVARSPADGFFKPWTGRNTSIDFAEADPNLIVRVFGGQVLGNPKDAAAGGAVSSDNGRTWTLFASRPDGAVDGVVAMAADGGRIVWTPENGATVVSTDRGRTWTSSAAMPWNLAVVADRKNAKVFYALDPATGVLYASEDGAATFAVRHTLPPGEGRLKAAYDKAGRLWLARPTGPFRSNDGGRSFERVDGLDSAVCVGFGKPVVDHDAAAVYAAARAGGHFGIFRSDDDGRSWERVNDDAHQYMQIAAISGDPRVAGRVYLASRSRGLVRGDPLPR